MAKRCHFCKKGPVSGNKVSHSNIKTRTRWLPNLHKVRTVEAGDTLSVKACSRCIRSGAVVRPVKRKAPPVVAKTA